VSALAVAATYLFMTPPAVARDTTSEFKVRVRLESGAHMATSRVYSPGGAIHAVSLRLPRAEPFRLRLEVIEPAVQSVEISGLGQIIRVGKDAVEIALPARSAIRALNLTCVIKYHEGAQPQGVPLRMTLIR